MCYAYQEHNSGRISSHSVYILQVGSRDVGCVFNPTDYTHHTIVLLLLYCTPPCEEVPRAAKKRLQICNIFYFKWSGIGWKIFLKYVLLPRPGRSIPGLKLLFVLTQQRPVHRQSSIDHMDQLTPTQFLSSLSTDLSWGKRNLNNKASYSIEFKAIQRISIYLHNQKVIRCDFIKNPK